MQSISIYYFLKRLIFKFIAGHCEGADEEAEAVDCEVKCEVPKKIFSNLKFRALCNKEVAENNTYNICRCKIVNLQSILNWHKKQEPIQSFSMKSLKMLTK